MNDELRPCPWEKPGEQHDLEMVDVGALMWVRCATCMAAGPCEDSREKAAAAWNARAAVTDEQFSLAVHDGETWQMSMCDEDDDDLPAYYRSYKCDACGKTHARYKGDDYDYCPRCGAKVTDE